jgi:hypothetical protein
LKSQRRILIYVIPRRGIIITTLLLSNSSPSLIKLFVVSDV